MRDLGVDATSELKHQAGTVLFTVTPADSEEALGKIRTALEVYLSLPSSPIENVAAGNEIEAQKLCANLHYLKSQLALSQAMIEAKNATIQAQQRTIEAQSFMRSDLVIDSVIEIAPAASRDQKEQLLGGRSHLRNTRARALKLICQKSTGA